MTAANNETASLVRRGQAPVRERAPFLFCVLSASDAAITPTRHRLSAIDEITIGRGGEPVSREVAERRLRIEVPDSAMSSAHARIARGSGGWVLRDEGSKNGTLVNGSMCRERKLADGDLIETGATFFLFAANLVADTRAPDDVAHDGGAPGLATLHPELESAFARVQTLASSLAPMLVCGPTGTGKEVVARAIHRTSKREGRFVAVNGGALAETLLESELFGHVAGAFSGATGDREGLIAAASGGTLFLDEVGELSARAQVVLLRALQEREVTPVGATTPVPVDLRVVAATNRDIVQMVADGDFRDDLLARLNGYSLLLPALRERRMDIGLILATLRARRSELARPLTVDAARFLCTHEWPRNVRELEKTLLTAAALAGGDPIDLDHLEDSVGVASAAISEPPPVAVDGERLGDQLRELLAANGGNISRVAELLGKKRQQIQRWCKKLGIDASAYRS